MKGTTFEEYISLRCVSAILKTLGLSEYTDFINEYNSFPPSGEIEDAFQGHIEFNSLGAELTSTNDVEWSLHMLARSFSRECLTCSKWFETYSLLQEECPRTDTRRSKEIDHEALAFAFDEIIKAQTFVMSFDQRLEKGLAAGRYNEISKGILVPGHILDILDIEFH